MIFNFLLTFLLVALNGFFVAAEFAIVKVRPSQIDTYEKASKTIRKTTHQILQQLDSYLAATQLGITLASLGLGWVGEGLIAQVLKNIFETLDLGISPTGIHAISIPLAFAAITFMHIVFGELAPKSIAIRSPIATTLYIALPLKIFHSLFSPFIWILNGMANMLLKLIGLHPIKEGEAFTEEELKLIVTESQEEGSIEETERNLIYNVFDFDERLVKDIVVPRTEIVSIDRADPIAQVFKVALENGFSRYPVYEKENDHIIGMLYTKDLLKIIHEDKKEDWTDHIRPPLFIPQHKKIKNLLTEMQVNKIQMALVVDEYGTMVGLVTIEDILEELVGEIQDEYDNEPPFVVQLDETTYKIDGQKSISDINKHLPVSILESAQFSTISGIALEHFENFPEEGSRFIHGNYEFKIIKTEGHVATQVLAKLIKNENII